MVIIAALVDLDKEQKMISVNMVLSVCLKFFPLQSYMA